MPERVQLRRTKGWRMPPNTVKVDRSTKWGNPHDWRDWRENFPPDVLVWEGAAFRDRWCREQATWAFRTDIETGFLQLPLSELKGKNLACWCPTGVRFCCHADVLLEIANREAPDA